MKILFLCHRFNSLSQRLYCELTERGHEVSIELDVHPDLMIEAVDLYRPDIVIAPFLKRKIPKEIWQKCITLVIHPGPPGDRGPNALDWAILGKKEKWGITIIEATEEYDAGDIYAYREFPLRFTKKSTIYRHEVTDGAVECVLEILENLEFGKINKQPQSDGVFNPVVPKDLRRIDWERDDTETILRKIYSSDGQPGAIANIFGNDYYLFNAYRESHLKGKPGQLLAHRDEAICIGTKDGAIWIGNMRLDEKNAIKLPAIRVLPPSLLNTLREETLKPWESVDFETYREIVYEELGGVGYINFNFYNGAMSTEQCYRLLEVIKYAKSRPVKAIVLLGSEDFFSNGMNLNTIEASESPADESWRNINAMDDICEEILTTTDKLTIAGLTGNAGAGGVFLALACDLVFAREGIVLNPHYKNIGNLYGSEFWTYTLPKRVGWEKAREIMENRMPISSSMALKLGLIDSVIGKSYREFVEKLKAKIESFVDSNEFKEFLNEVREEKEKSWAIKPLRSYREEELEHMKLNFYGFDTSYHIARYYFVRRFLPFRTPPYLAIHRRYQRV